MPKQLDEAFYLCTDMPSIFNEHVIYSITDVNGIITDVSNAFCHETGYKREEVIGRTHSFLRAPDFPLETYTRLWETISKNETWEGQIKNIRKNGDTYWMKSIIQPYFNEDNEKIGYLALRQNITKEKACEALSMVDELTGAYNRRKFNLEINNYLINYYRYQENFSLVMIDIDHFKNFNDTYGHLVGDQVLKRVCSVMKNSVRKGDFFSRWGGEEFALVLHNVDKSIAKSTCNKLLNRVRLDLPQFLLENFKIETPLTCSMGITSPQSSDSVESLLTRADSALYYAKSGGRNRAELL